MDEHIRKAVEDSGCHILTVEEFLELAKTSGDPPSASGDPPSMTVPVSPLLPITDDASLDRAIAEIDRLLDQGIETLSDTEDELLDALGTAVHAYEAEHDPISGDGDETIEAPEPPTP